MEIPTIRIEPPEDYGELDAALLRLPGFDWVVFTSANAVDAVFDRLRGRGLDARALHGTRVAAIGRSTADSLHDVGIAADLVASLSISEGLVKDMAARNVVRVPHPGAGRRDEARGPRLRSRGARRGGGGGRGPTEPSTSRDRPPPLTRPSRTASTSRPSRAHRPSGDSCASSTATWGSSKASPSPASAPSPAAEARNAGLDVAILARESTVNGLVEAIIDYYGGGSPSP